MKVPTLSVVFVFFVAAVFYSEPAAFAALPQQAVFTAGEEVATDGVTNVRAIADGALLGMQKKGSLGKIVSGPTLISGNSVTWYQVNFSTAPSGWVGGDMLVAASTNPISQTVVLGTGTDQTMILDEFGNIDVAWNGINNTYQFTASFNHGLSWTTPTSLPMSPAVPMSPLGPTMAAEANGAIDVAFPCLPSQCPGNLGNPSMQLIRSINNGATWSNPVQISLPVHGSGSGAAEPVMAACGAGVTIAWQDDGVGSNFGNLNPDIILVHVIGGVPSTPVNLSNTTGSEGHPQIAVNAQSNVFVTWVTDNNQGGGLATDSIVFASLPNCGVAKTSH
jgi:hypothetical protein